MIRSFATAVVTAVLLTSAAYAADPQAKFNCQIKDGGKTLSVIGSNPTDRQQKCTIHCAYHSADDQTINLPCSATIDPKQTNKVFCETTEDKRKVSYVEGMAQKCS